MRLSARAALLADDRPARRVADARAAVRTAAAALLDRQDTHGAWTGRIACDPAVTAQHLLTARYLDRLEPGVEAPMLAHLCRAQLPGGGWAAYPGGPPSVDVSLSCYAALKLAGWPAEHPVLSRARGAILAHGGLEAAGFLSRIPLVFWGQIPDRVITYLSPKFLFAPPWLRPHVREIGVFLQAALAVWLLEKRGAGRTPPPGRGLDELRRGTPFPRVSWGLLGAALSTLGRWADAIVPAPALDRRAAGWLAERQNADGLWAGMTLITNRNLMALAEVDRDRYRPAIEAAFRGLERLHVVEGGTRWQMFGRSSVLDTALAVRALLDGGVPAGHPRLCAAFTWLIDVQPRIAGDWQFGAPHVAPGGWSLTPENDRNPDVDTTLHVLEVLSRAPAGLPGRGEALARGLAWLLGMQNADGSWGMFALHTARLSSIRELTRQGLTDAGTPDVTARVVRALVSVRALPGQDRRGVRAAVSRALARLARTQRPDGAWNGRWAVHYAYGAAQGLTAFALAHPGGPHAARARGFLGRAQGDDGGWGESPESYERGCFCPAPGTVTQTGLALLGLLTNGAPGDPCVDAGVDWLLERFDRVSATWSDSAWSQTLLPGCMYFQNALLAPCLGLSAVARYLRTMGAPPERAMTGRTAGLPAGTDT